MKTIIAFLFVTFYSSTLFSQDVVGHWMGDLTIPTGKLEIAFKIVKNDELYEATMDIPKQGLSDYKAESTTLVDSTVTITFPALNIEYKGRVNDKNEIIGKLFQGASGLSLNLKRGEIILKRPQEPKPPFNYYSEKVTFKTSDNLKLEGTLTLPKKDGKFPVVIIISGSGPQNRDGDMFGHKPYYVIADQLTKNGIGVLRYDERGVGDSEGDFENANIDVLSSDVNSAIGYLKTRKEVNVKKIGLIGHSIGGIIAPKVASANNMVNYIVLMAGPGINGDKLMLLQKAALERLMGYNELQIAQAQDVVKGAYDIIVSSTLENQPLKDSINSYYLKKYGALFPENQREALVEQITGNEVLSLIRSKPSEYLEKVTCPVLAINGDKDFQVPATENLEAIRTAVEKNGNKKVTIVELPNLNHLFQECNTGMLTEYSEIEQTIAPEVLDLISNWIKEQTK